MTQQRVVVGMSGGVDSAVSAALLKEQGYDVIGVTLNLSPKVNEADAWERDDSCCGLSASEDARRVADRIGIPHYVLNFRDVFAEKVIANFLDEYRRGRTPNPCIRCNDHIKFGTVLLKARALDAELVATGHYARVETDPETGRRVLRRAVDLRKDQSYVLYVLTQEELRRTLFPLGGLTKQETRELARKLRLPVAEKPESQDICFVNERNYGDFLKKLAPDIAQPGPIVDLDGRVLGEHRGIAFYTIGQRRGLGVVSADPLYVIDVDAASRTVVVGPEAALYDHELIADEANFVQVGAIPEPLPVKARVRYRMVDAEATVQQIGLDQIKVRFAEPQRAITPGQAVVCYADDLVVAGGTITSTSRTRRVDGLFEPRAQVASAVNPAGMVRPTILR
ncbi:MAG TPA: tRNA 2-thiouridine(34) synthase MnmA [Chloroflexota bacterium]|nr:tRNA 2-thiouridine(34) synthase MnmA [Chloroflexota bacterium]